jgi:hypothetical protein
MPTEHLSLNHDLGILGVGWWCWHYIFLRLTVTILYKCTYSPFNFHRIYWILLTFHLKLCQQTNRCAYSTTEYSQGTAHLVLPTWILKLKIIEWVGDGFTSHHLAQHPMCIFQKTNTHTHTHWGGGKNLGRVFNTTISDPERVNSPVQIKSMLGLP